MVLNKLYEKQAKLDKYILEKHNMEMSKEELLDNTILALLVEVGELANTTRCFKHWSTKGMMDKEIVLDEFSDCLHFYLSIGNQLGCKFDRLSEHQIHYVRGFKMVDVFLDIYNDISNLDGDYDYLEYHYVVLGHRLEALGNSLNFTDEEIEQAYLKKHEENYKRQREGY